MVNKLFIIGNLTNDPIQRATADGKNVTTFSVAVNRRNDGTDYFKVSVWGRMSDPCAKYLSKGRKVSVIGKVSVSTYQASDGTTRASMEVNANEVEFLSPRANAGGRENIEDDELPI